MHQSASNYTEIAVSKLHVPYRPRIIARNQIYLMPFAGCIHTYISQRIEHNLCTWHTTTQRALAPKIRTKILRTFNFPMHFIMPQQTSSFNLAVVKARAKIIAVRSRLFRHSIGKIKTYFLSIILGRTNSVDLVICEATKCVKKLPSVATA